MRLADFLDPSAVTFDLGGEDRDAAFGRLVDLLQMNEKSASTRPAVTANPAIGPDASAREMIVASPGPGDNARKNMPMAKAMADSRVMV